ncbi:MAG: uracil-DNA glycosylase [Ignavibacteria bacterium]|jgi:uracil-DNA glycosylase family 4
MVDPRTELLRYLRQQEQMYGRTLYVDNVERPVRSLPPSQPEPETMLAENLSQTLPAMEVASSTGHEDVTSLEQFNTKICGCMKCALGATRTNFVFGSGNANADIMVIGEAPGADEDEQGLPFVGRAGQLLTKILESVELGRDDVYICNILKCRPPNNRKPLASETDQCEPYLWKQIELIKPKFILALGLTAANTLLKNKESMTQLRGRIHDYQGIRTIVTYHPAALLRNPDWKKHTWEDVKFLRKLYQETL